MITFKKFVALLLAAFMVISFASLAHAYSIQYNGDKTEAKVYCDNRDLAGTFFWNGTQWSNGVNSGTDIDALAKKQVALNGRACK